MNFKAIKRAEELRLNIENQDNERRERVERKAPSRSSFVINNGMALEFL